MHVDQSQRNEGPTIKVQHACAYLGARDRVVQKGIGEHTCSCSHVRRERSLLDRSINDRNLTPDDITVTKMCFYTNKFIKVHDGPNQCLQTNSLLALRLPSV